jgi:hypothetical protein
MEIIPFFRALPKYLRYYILDFLDFDYYEYFFYSRHRKQRGMTIIKYPFYRFLCREDDAIGFIARRDIATTI